VDEAKADGAVDSFITLTPCIPLSGLGEGEVFIFEGAGAPSSFPGIIDPTPQDFRLRGNDNPSVILRERSDRKISFDYRTGFFASLRMTGKRLRTTARERMAGISFEITSARSRFLFFPPLKKSLSRT
jgi:hypothetical protein